MQLLIYGAPGAGKTTASRLLHKKTGKPLYEGDYLREVELPEEIGASEDPFLYIGTKQAWRHFGKLTSENVVKGLTAVRQSMRPYVDRELAKRPGVIFEASFLDPAQYPSASIYLVVTPDEARHRRQFFEHREVSEELNEGFRASRLMQAYLIEEANKFKLAIIRNIKDEGALLAQFEEQV